MWKILIGVTLISTIFTSAIVTSILLESELRSNIFNIILTFCLIPDFLFSFLCLITFSINLGSPEYGIYEWHTMCDMQAIYVTFEFTASPYMAALAMHEVNKLLHSNRWALTYEPVAHRVLLLRIGVVYVWSVFVSVWTVIPGLPHRSSILGGYACFPDFYSKESRLFFSIVFIPTVILIPFTYIFYLWVRAYYTGLYRQLHHARPLTWFFCRINIVLLAFWIPSYIFIWVLPVSDWFKWAGGVWSHLQGTASAALCLTKPDIRLTMYHFVNRIVYAAKSSANAVWTMFSKK